jgi:Fe-S oxidoreductase
MDADLITQIKKCLDCDVCLDVCPTYIVTGNLLFSPKGRLRAAQDVIERNVISDEEVRSFYNCPKCAACEVVCPEKIEVSKIVAQIRNRIVENGKGPLPVHKKIIEGILEKGNSVNGDPAKRLEWLPEPFEFRRSPTLLFLGCLPSYLVKDAALYSYLVLKKLGVDFMILKDEGCCGTYIYESGEVELARRYFKKNVERFKKLGVTRLIVPCNGCFKCFKYFYPEVLGSVHFEVFHVVQVIYSEIKKDTSLLKKVESKATYQDSCRLGRVERYTEEPRELLKWCGVEVYELPRSREHALCCGSGGGIRSAFKELSFDIACNLLKQTETEKLISPCPFCTFNLEYTNKNAKMGKKITYITKVVWESLIQENT